MNKAPRYSAELTALVGTLTLKGALPAALSDPAEKEQVVPEPGEGVAQKREIPQKKPKKQPLMAWESIQHKINTNKVIKKKKKNMAMRMERMEE